MKIGKREQIVFISIGTLVAIALIHMFIFKPRAEKYAETEGLYKAGMEKISAAEIPESPRQIDNFNSLTSQYRDDLTTFVASLNLNVPDCYTSLTMESVMARLDEMYGYLTELNNLRNTLKTPQLSFLNDRRQNPADPYSPQQGWNLPAQLPSGGVAGALWDNVKKLDDRYTLLQAIQNPVDRLRSRVPYNQYLMELGINPAEVSDWVVNLPGAGYVFFNDAELARKVPGAVKNPLSINQFGVVLPHIKRAWIAEMIWAKREANAQIDRVRLYHILEMDLNPDYCLLINRQLAALLDVVKLAQQNSITEIQRVNLLKPAKIAKGVIRAEGQTPTPSPTPSPTPAGAAAAAGMDPAMMEMMMMDPAMGGMGAGMGAAATPALADLIGEGTGIEIWLRAPNSNTIKFLFDVTHVPRTYALDDLNIDAVPDGQLITSTTIELVSTLDSLAKKP